MKQLPHRFAEPLDRGNITSSPYLGDGRRPGVLSTKGLRESGGVTAQNVRRISGFTLVELIVVITILVILGTIAFINLGNFAGSARDGARVENLANLEKGLNLYQIKAGTYPMPENAVVLTASGIPIGYQGFARDQVASIAKLSKGGTVDPSDANMYPTYSVNANQTKMSLMGFLEDGSSVTALTPPNLPLSGEEYAYLSPNLLLSGEEYMYLPLIRGIKGVIGADTAFASASSDYSKRTPTLRGDTLWILLGNGTGNLNQPVQENFSVGSFTGVDILNTTGSYTMQFSNTEKISGTWMTLRSGIGGGGLVSYWNFEEWSGVIAYDKITKLPWYFTGWYLTGWTTLPTWSGGKLGGGLEFYWSWFVVNYNSWLLNQSGQFTIQAWIYPKTWSNIASLGYIAGQSNNYGLAMRFGNPIGGYHSPQLNKWTWDYYNNGSMSCAWSPISCTWTWYNGIISTPTINTWHHILFVNNWSKIMQYIDGVQVYNNISKAIGSSISLGYLVIWWHQGLNAAGFNWLIDEVRIYNRALSDSEIQALYSATK